MSGKYTTLICYIFTINYILGVGCLGIPYAFLRSGVVLGSLLIIVLSSVAYMTVMWVAESGHRDMEIRRLEDAMTPITQTPGTGDCGKRRRRRSRGRTLSNGTPETKRLTMDTLEFGSGRYSRDSTPTNASQSKPSKNYGSLFTPSQNNSSKKSGKVEFSSLSELIEQNVASATTPSPTTAMYSPQSNQHKHRLRLPSEDFTVIDVDGDGEAEVVELVLRFLGPNAKSCYQVAVMLLMSIGLIAYTQVFVQTFIQQLWPTVPAYLPSVMFALVVVPLSCVDLAEQINIQVVMSILRFVSLATLVVGTLVAVCMDRQDSGYSDVPDEENHVPLYNISGFSLMFTTAIFSQLFQHSVPGLIRPLQPQDKRKVPHVFMYALCTTGFFYLVIGISSVYYFGPKINQAINLNFVNFVWGLQDMPVLVEVFVRSMSMVVVLFPALDTVSVYPLIANTLGNNLNVSFPYTYKSVQSFLDEYTSIQMSRCEVRKVTTQCWRLVAAVPPIIWSVFIKDLSLTLQFAGLCGIVVALITPSLLQYYSILELEETIEQCYTSKAAEEDEDFSEEAMNPYAGAFSHVYFTYGTMVLAAFALIACTYQIYDSA
jgi:amino acid permease